MKITIEMLSKEQKPCEDGAAWFEKEPDHNLVALVKSAIKQGKQTMEWCGWGMCAVMTKEQKTEWNIFSAYQRAHLWKKDYPKEYAIWDKWASGKDRSDTARAAARAAAWAAASDAAGAAAWAAAGAAASDTAWDAAWDTARAAAWAAAYNKTLAKILRYGVKLLWRDL